jgi:2-iminobutanoate/2-iminopropanoate deaminase
MQKEVQSADAPAAIGPYSQAIMAGSTLYMSGQIALDPITGQMVGNTAEAQTRQVLKNMAAVLSEVGLDFSNLVQCTIYLSTMDDFGIVNEIYGSAMSSPAPARGTVAVKTLPKNALVEIVGVAYQAPA